MALAFLTLGIAAIPTTIGVAEGVSYQRQQTAQSQNTDEDEKRMAKFQLEVYCDAKSSRSKEIHGRRVVLRDDKVYISSSSTPSAHPVTAFYILYPDPDRPPTLGLVSTISLDPPVLNWIYVDKDTLELKYGNRTQSREHLVGPWGWTPAEEEDENDGDLVRRKGDKQEDENGKGTWKEGEGEGLVFEGWEGFVAVEEEEGVWGVRFDKRDDGLKGVQGMKEKKILQISLERKMLEDG